MTYPEDEPVLPDTTTDETDTGWSERSQTDDEDVQRLLDERPPHHDRE